jgi:hypothetical protein
LGNDAVVMASGGACTVSSVLPVIPLRVTEIVLVPALTPVAHPVLAPIVATALFDEDQASGLVRVCVLPSE